MSFSVFFLTKNPSWIRHYCMRMVYDNHATAQLWMMNDYGLVKEYRTKFFTIDNSKSLVKDNTKSLVKEVFPWKSGYLCELELLKDRSSIIIIQTSNAMDDRFLSLPLSLMRTLSFSFVWKGIFGTSDKLKNHYFRDTSSFVPLENTRQFFDLMKKSTIWTVLLKEWYSFQKLPLKRYHKNNHLYIYHK